MVFLTKQLLNELFCLQALDQADKREQFFQGKKRTEQLQLEAAAKAHKKTNGQNRSAGQNKNTAQHKNASATKTSKSARTGDGGSKASRTVDVGSKVSKSTRNGDGSTARAVSPDKPDLLDDSSTDESESEEPPKKKPRAPPTKPFQPKVKNGLVVNMSENVCGVFMGRYTSAKAQVKDLAAEVETFKVEVADLRKLTGEQQLTIQDLKRDMQEDSSGQAAEVKSLTNQVQLLKSALLEAKQALKDAGRHSRKEELGAVKKAIVKYIKIFGFRKHVFLRGAQLDSFVKQVYLSIKSDLGLDDENADHYTPLDEFSRIYTGSCQTAVGDRRQYVQTGCYQACFSGSFVSESPLHLHSLCSPANQLNFMSPEYYKDEGEMVPVEWLEKLYNDLASVVLNQNSEDDDSGEDTPELSPEDQQMLAKKRRFVTWYFDVFLPKVSGYDENFKPEIRHYRLPVDPMKVVVNGTAQKVPHISEQNEGFGVVIIKNCHPKWTKIFSKRIEDPDFEIPAYDKDKPETHDYHTTLWSDGRTGQVKAGGWAPEAYDELSRQISRIHAFRKEDRATGYRCHRALHKIMREELGISGDGPSRKRRRRGRSVQVPVFNPVAEFSDVEFPDSDDEEGSTPTPMVEV